MNTINVGDALDRSKFNRFHLLVMFWCFFVITFDGFDLIVYGSVLPELMKEWNMSAIQSGAIGSYALIGMMLGALIFGPIADRIGRKNVTLLSTFLFSLFSALSSMADDPTEFGIYRLLTGIGLGGSLPNVIALMTEYAPLKYRNLIVAIMSTGYSVGGVLAAGLAIPLLPQYGWSALFLIGALPILSIPLMYKYMPESVNFYVLQNKQEEIPAILSQIDPQYRPQPNDRFKINVPKQSGLPVISLFQHGRALGTVMIWIVIFMSLLMIYGLNTWLPKLMMSAGYPFGSSLLFLLVLNVGAIVGAIFGGWLADRWQAKYVLILYYLMAAISLILLGLKTNMFLLYIFVAIAGATTIGSQMISNIFTVQYYPNNMRSTGIGWALGMGRLGGIVGPSLGGVLLSLNLSFQINFVIFAIPGIIAALALFFVANRRAHS